MEWFPRRQLVARETTRPVAGSATSRRIPSVPSWFRGLRTASALAETLHSTALMNSARLRTLPIGDATESDEVEPIALAGGELVLDYADRARAALFEVLRTSGEDWGKAQIATWLWSWYRHAVVRETASRSTRPARAVAEDRLRGIVTDCVKSLW